MAPKSANQNEKMTAKTVEKKELLISVKSDVIRLELHSWVTDESISGLVKDLQTICADLLIAEVKHTREIKFAVQTGVESRQ